LAIQVFHHIKAPRVLRMMVFNKSDGCRKSRVKEIELELVWGYK
jgi:hypothetical protein